MRLFITFILAGFFYSNSFTAHIIGGEISYECLGNDEYRVTIELYRDCGGGGADFDIPLLLFVYDGLTNDRIIGQEYLVYVPQIEYLDVVFNNPCSSPPPGICVQKGTYQQIVNLPPNPNGYTIAYQRCCRGANVTNLIDPETQGVTLSTFVPGTNSGINCNSSPKFNNYPPLVLCLNEQLVFDHAATDPDGDSLVYELCAPFQGGSQATPQPNPASDPPYQFINYAGAYSSALPLGASANLVIDSQTGLLTGTPQQLGLYAVGICVSEYRNGQLINTNRREILFRVTSCDPLTNAVITPQADLPDFTSICQGLTVNFLNQSVNQALNPTIFWDFGVDGIDSDTSNALNPSFTFPAEGDYVVTLILNRGSNCSDTTTQVFEVYESFNIDIMNDGPHCITNNSFDFLAFGDIDNSTSFAWDFGANASINFSSDSMVNNVVFNATGYLPIICTATRNQCISTAYDTIFIFQEPTIDFAFDDNLLCVPTSVGFTDLSTASTPIQYFWEFGNGLTSSSANPTTIYDIPGVYDVSLTIYTDSGCVDTLNLNKPSLVEVFPSPIAGISADRYTVNPYDPLIEFTEQCMNHTSFIIHVDSNTSTTSPYVHGFIQSGDHFPYIVAYNDYGCSDTAYTQVYVESIKTILIPNAFTPNGDGKNDYLTPVILDVESYEFKIYNRLGKVIYESSAYGDRWDGTYKGQKVPDGVYVFHLRYKDLSQIPHETYGHVTILR